MNSIFITIRKEIRSILRDKKTLFTLLIFPLFIPVMIFLYAYMYEDTEEEKNYLVGINYEVNSIESGLIDQANLDVLKYDSLSEMIDAYNDGKIFGYIDYSEDKNTYTVYVNQDSSDGMYVYGYINAYLNDKIIYSGGVIDDLKSLEISNNGGILGFRIAVENLGNYISNEDEEPR